MASSALFLLLLLLLFITLSSPILLLQIHARHIDFISKIPTRRLGTVRIVNAQQSPQPQPEFVRQNQDGHGLYGHKNIHSSETKSDNVEIETDDQSQTKKGSIGKHNYSDELNARYNAYRAAVQRQRLRGSSSAMKDSISFANGKHLYVLGKEQNQNAAFKATVQSQNRGMSDARSFANGKHFYVLENERNQNAAFKATMQSQNRGGSYGMSDDARSFANGKHFYVLDKEQNQNAAFKASVRNQNRGGSSAERKGMSDTRFLENGRYFYDMENEQNQYGGRHDNKFDYENEGEKDGFNMVEEYGRSRHNQYDP